METSEFEQIAQEEYENLPDVFRAKIENVRIVVEELPDDSVMRKTGVSSPYHLLGLYQGIPLNCRNTAYGSFAIVPDTITLYKQNIESAVSHGEASLRDKIHEVLIHEIAHYFGMTEEEIRRAGY